MSGSGVQDTGLVRRPPVHPSRSSASVSPSSSSANVALRPPIHPSRSSVNSSVGSSSPSALPAPPPYASPNLSPAPPPTAPRLSPKAPPTQLPPRDFRPESSSSHLPPASPVTQATPSLPPRPSAPAAAAVSSPPLSSFTASEEDSGSESDSESGAATPTPELGGGPSTDTLGTPIESKDEEELSEIQLRELYDDEEIDRFLNLFSSYVREVRATQPAGAGPGRGGEPASASAPDITEHGPSVPSPSTASLAPPTKINWDRPISEAIAMELVVPLLPPPRAPLPNFSIGRLRQTAQRLYVALEPMYTRLGVPLLRLATWTDPRQSFVYCALYWILWYHGLLLSAFALGVLYELVRRKLHPYPSLAELREHRRSIDRSQAVGRLLATRLANAPSLGVRDVWDIFGDYRHLRKLKKAKREAAGKIGPDATEELVSGDDTSTIRSASLSTGDLPQPQDGSAQEAQEDADLKRLGLFVMNETADFLERIKNIFLWREPTASVIYGTVILGWFLFGFLPARYLVKLVGAVVGGVFWHVIPVAVAIPPSERNRFPSPLSIVPTDTEYAMELISQRVARGLPVKARRKRFGRQSSKSSLFEAESALGHGSSSSVDWKKVGERIATTKEMAGDLKGIFRDGQANSWKALNPLASKTVATHGGLEPCIETQTFPATTRAHGPGLITLTSTTLFFTPLLSSHPVLTIELANVSGVKKTKLTKGLDIRYSYQSESGRTEDKEASFQLVGARSELFARLVGSGGKKWAKV
ncbi:hypothetical protein DICSQDRAFT_164561 [Dichomitus squalens LYAD-421 SS1]|uniref:uncharacterized protein n=1 Tax=Dichomitus squalens (strain LYAD-421) TaxID=732165 RepID=UPI0004410A7C|nr:uncharacterized protein DICSQDRAFT_164561 [Dichomitus squalens LYAD-421 SS1]EJF66720.1 hypothetical protein DICSQDRAFT_164561 [Dichomitus squalens LYAD-421 SS1]